ncbi:MAG: type II toxin-antitoxin system VapC family toxin [Sphaerospermopsis kisseleviana]
MTYMNNCLFIDTWGWLTLHDRQESYHQETVNFYRKFLANQGIIYTTDYILDETFTLFFKRLGSYQAKLSMDLLLNFINADRFAATCKMRVKYSDKPLISFTDLSSMVVMQELQISLVLTGDEHFNQVGMEFIKVP